MRINRILLQMAIAAAFGAGVVYLKADQRADNAVILGLLVRDRIACHSGVADDILRCDAG